MTKFRPFDYLTDEEKKDVLRYESLINESTSVRDFIKFERVLDAYRRLGIMRRQIEDIAEQESVRFNEFTEEEKLQHMELRFQDLKNHLTKGKESELPYFSHSIIYAEELEWLIGNTKKLMLYEKNETSAI